MFLQKVQLMIAAALGVTFKLAPAEWIIIMMMIMMIITIISIKHDHHHQQSIKVL